MTADKSLAAPNRQPTQSAEAVPAIDVNNTATALDRLFQLGFILAYRLLAIWWFLTHPKTRGAICAVWSGGRVLLVRSPYRPYFSFPGGFINRRETASQAALRELREEVSISITPEQLKFSSRTVESRQHREEHTEIFEVEMAIEPHVRIDNREIIEAAFLSPAQALKLNLLPPARQYILDKSREQNLPTR